MCGGPRASVDGRANRPWAEALAVAGPSTRIVDAKGALVTPGFVDAHIHLMAFERAHPVPPISLQFVRGRQQVADRISSYAARLPKGSWILGEDWIEGRI